MVMDLRMSFETDWESVVLVTVFLEPDGYDAKE